jgi:hypothetical protein
MGQRRTADIETWQQLAGITPASRERAHTIDRLSKLAVELIKTIELERSGIRDGDGAWSGCDPIAGIVHNIVEAERADLQAWNSETRPGSIGAPSGDAAA